MKISNKTSENFHKYLLSRPLTLRQLTALEDAELIDRIEGKLTDKGLVLAFRIAQTEKDTHLPLAIHTLRGAFRRYSPGFFERGNTLSDMEVVRGMTWLAYAAKHRLNSKGESA